MREMLRKHIFDERGELRLAHGNDAHALAIMRADPCEIGARHIRGCNDKFPMPPRPRQKRPLQIIVEIARREQSNIRHVVENIDEINRR